MSLKPIKPEAALKLFLKDKEAEHADAWIKGHDYWLRHFVRWLEAVDGVEQDFSEKVLSPTITADENSRDVKLDSDHASSVLSHLEKYEYAGPEHVALTLMWYTTMRVGGVHVLDVDDYDTEEQYMEVRHRPDTGTPIKNKGNGERLIALSDDICKLLDD